MPTPVYTAYVPVTNNSDDVVVKNVVLWPKGKTLFLPYDKSVDCAAEQALINSLVTQINAAATAGNANGYATLMAQLLAYTVASVPDAPAGNKWVIRPCSGGSTPTSDDITLTEVDPDTSTYVDGILEDLGVLGDPGFDTSYTLVKSGADYNGTSFVTQSAPTLLSVARTAPRRKGNWFPFLTQLAMNTALHKRRAPFATHTRKTIVFPGNLYTDPADNEFTGRGWTHSSEATLSGESVYPVGIKRCIESAFYDRATAAANVTQGGDIPTDTQKAQLLAWASAPHVPISDDGAARLYAKKWVDVFEQQDWFGGGIEGFSVNHEVYSGTFQAHYNHSGLMTRAIREEMESRLKGDGSRKFPIVKAAATDYGALVHYSPYALDFRATQSNNFDPNTPDPDPSVPVWLHFVSIAEPYKGVSRSAPLGTFSILAQLLKAGKLYAGSGQYPRYTMDDQTMWQKNGDGSYKTNTNGWMLPRTDVRTTVVNGEACPLLETDYTKSMQQLYGYYCQFYAYYFFRAGSKHLPMSTDVMAGWEAMQRGYAQFRLNTEVDTTYNYVGQGLDPETYNRRPLNRKWTETYAIGMYLYMDYLRGWMNVQNRTDLGGVNTHDGQSRASVEFYANGFQRGADLNWIHDTPYQFVVPKFFLFEQATNEWEQLWRKPIVIGGLATYGGKPTLWLHWVWPCQDEDRVTDMIIWVDKGQGPVTPGYLAQFEGRDPGLEYWQFPNAAAGAQPKDLYFQFKSFLNETITWRGDYRETRITLHPTPPALA
ncbi:MAG: hypothetical protein JWP57_707 [Spirosoma sp.]|nr:hypothetical protein [Spirosoma sp.]